MNTELAPDYAHRCFTALGQSAHDPQQVTNWCYANPPKKPLPKTKGERTNNVYLPRDVVRCLAAVGNASSLAESILRLWISEQVPEVQAMYERHDQEAEMCLAALRQNEPQLQTQEEEL